MCPVLFHLGELPVSGYWMMMAIGLLISYVYMRVMNGTYKEQKLPWYHINNLGCLCMISIFIGGILMGFLIRLPYFIENWSSYEGNWLLLVGEAVERRAFYGGAVVLVLTFLWYIKHYDLPGQQVAEIFTPVAALFMFFGRLGCFLGGCCYGIPVSWGLVFPEGSLAPAGIPLFPSQLVEALGHLLLFFLLHGIRGRVKWKYNLLFLYGGCYGILRFLMEFVRGDEARGKWWIFSTSQWISLIIVVGILIYFIFYRKRGVFHVTTNKTKNSPI